MTLATVAAADAETVEAAEARLVEEYAEKVREMPLLHYATEKGVPLELMRLLLKANSEAAISVDKARCCT